MTTVLAALLAASISIFSSVRGPGPEWAVQVESQQNQQTEKDYMNNLLSRDTNPLWLKDNPVLRRYLAEPAVKWAVRSARIHILH